MRSTYLPSSLASILLRFAPCFTAPSLENFRALVCGWIFCRGRHTVTQAILGARALGLGGRHHSTIYRFLARAQWSVEEVSHVVFRLLLPFLPDRIDAAVDDTLCHRTGPQIFGAGMHHDAARSTYGGHRGRQVNFSFGHNWVVLSVWVPLPWNASRGIAVPVNFRLYRSKKRCPEELYRKRTELAREMLERLCGWLPPERRISLAGDQEYGCRTLLADLPEQVEFCGALPLDAALFAPPPKRQRRRGRPARKGRRLPTPAQMFEQASAPWERKKIVLYGKEVSMQVRTFEALWFRVRGPRPVRVVLTRDPSGHYKDRAFFGTNPQRSEEEILQGVVRRWPLETTFEAGKGIVGIEEPRNGWWRRPHGTRRPLRKAGPEPHAERGRLAVERTVPLLFTAYAVVILWYLANGKPQRDVAHVRQLMPWYTLKTQPCYADMATALRRELWRARIPRDVPPRALRAKIALVDAILESAA